MKPFAVFDLDGTLIRWQLYHAVFDYLAKHGGIDPELYARVTSARMDWKRRMGDFDSYQMTLVEMFEQMLQSMNVPRFDEAAHKIFQEHRDQVYVYTRELVKSLKKQGYLLFAISGSPIEAVQQVARHYGFDDCLGATFHQKNGHFTGKITTPVLNKKTALSKLIDKHNLELGDSIAVGDTESDIEMLDMVQRPIAFNPSKKLFDHARKLSWEIVVERKNVVYKLAAQNGSYSLS